MHSTSPFAVNPSLFVRTAPSSPLSFHAMLSLRGEPSREPPMTDEDTDANARATAHALIQGYLGPDHKVIDMAAFYSALVQALREAQQNAKR